MTPTIFIYCGTTGATIRPRLRLLLRHSGINLEAMAHLVAVPGKARLNDFYEQLRAASSIGRCVQLVLDSRDEDGRAVLADYCKALCKSEADWAAAEVALLCRSESDEAEYARVAANQSNGCRLPMIWCVMTKAKFGASAADSFAQFLAALATAKRPSRMHGHDSLSSLRESEGRFVSNSIAWFSLPPLEWIAATLLHRDMWHSSYGRATQPDPVAQAQQLLLECNAGKNEPARSSTYMFAQRVRSFTMDCLPRLYELVASYSSDAAQAAQMLRAFGTELMGAGLGSKELRSETAAEAILELFIELGNLSAKIEKESLELNAIAARYTPLAAWMQESESVLERALNLLRESPWSPLSLILTANFVPIQRRGQEAWSRALEAVREKLLSCFILWKRHEATKMFEGFHGAKRLLEFVPAELSVDSNDELWPLKENVAIIVQRERSFR